MLVEKITSRQNPLVTRFKRVRTGLERHHVLVEGVRLIEEAIAAGVHFESIAFTADLEASERGLTLKDELQHVPCRGALVTKQVMTYISDTETPQGVAAIISRPHFSLEDVFSAPGQLIVIADGIQDPGNIGTIIRTAEAAGATGLVALSGTVSPFNSKAIRASMGSALRLPVAMDAKVAEVVELMAKFEVASIAAMPRGPDGDESTPASRLYTDVDYRKPSALILGRESTGLSGDLAGKTQSFVHIPMAAGVESLNVAAAASVLLYEAARQRGWWLTAAHSSAGEGA
jgi:TrmH family RNA methyltransferase